jgi:hypothetical protein
MMVGAHDRTRRAGVDAVKRQGQARAWAVPVTGVALPTATGLQLTVARQAMLEVAVKALAFQAAGRLPMQSEAALHPNIAMLATLSTLEMSVLVVAPQAHSLDPPWAPVVARPAMLLAWIHEAHTSAAHPRRHLEEAVQHTKPHIRAGTVTRVDTRADTKVATRVDTKVDTKVVIKVEVQVEEVETAEEEAASSKSSSKSNSRSSVRRTNRATLATLVAALPWRVMAFQLEQAAPRSGQGHPRHRLALARHSNCASQSMMTTRHRGCRDCQSGSKSSPHWAWLPHQHGGAQISWTPGRSPGTRPGMARP